jgi:hypothetical protein
MRAEFPQATRPGKGNFDEVEKFDDEAEGTFLASLRMET